MSVSSSPPTVENGKRTSSRNAERLLRVRMVIIARWNELTEDLNHLERAIARLPAGVFNDDEQTDLTLTAEQIRTLFTDSRPLPRPSSAARRRMWARRMQRLADS